MAATRRLAAILAADVAGYSRLMGANEEGTLERLKALRRELVDPKIAEHHGRIVKTTGDGILVEFASVVDAVRCAVEVQQAIPERNAGFAVSSRIELRIGINLGDVIVEGDDLYGDGVNVAARIEAFADVGGVFVSSTVHDQVRDRLPFVFEDLGEQQVKNIVRPVRVYALSAAAVAALPPVAVMAYDGNSLAPMRVPRLSVVVLPFANLSSDPEQEYFADGISDDLTADLSLIPDSFIIARTTAFSYKGKPLDVRQIGRELGVRYVLEGSVRRAGGQVQVTAQLIDTESGSHIWADRFDADRADLAKAQEEIVGRLYQTMQLELIEAAASRIEQEKPANPDSRDLVIRGWALYNRPKSTANQEAALRAFEQALDIHSASVEARVGIATVLGEYLALGWRRSPEDMARAEQMLVEAFARNRNHLRALFEMGRLRRLQNRLSESKIELEKAIALDRNHSAAMLQLGITLLFLGQPQAALPHLEKTMRLRPLFQNIFFPYYWMGYSHLLLAHIDEAIDLMRKCRAANPKLPDTHMLLAAALALRGEIDEAKTSLAEALRLNLWFKSFAQLHGDAPAYMTNPAFVVLREQTVEAGLRRIGFPAE